MGTNGRQAMKEGKSLEFKSEISRSFLKTVSAYANCGTGIIKFGVRDDGTIVGLADPLEARLRIENAINDSITPKPDFALSTCAKSRTVTLKVIEGQYKPYLYHGKAYRRNDTSTVEMDPLERKRLAMESSNLNYEQLPADPMNPSFKFLEAKLKERLKVEKFSSDLLKTLGFLTKSGQLNIAGSLFADQNPWPGIDAVRFGNSINEINERQTFAGTSLLCQYDEVVSMLERNYSVERITGKVRERLDRIPLEAFRESVANALVHRNWDINSQIRILMHPNRVEIASPGGLPYGISEREYLNGQVSVLRNPIIGNAFFRLGYIEKFGTGINRIKEAYRGQGASPCFEIGDNSVMVTLPAIDFSGIATTPCERQVLSALQGGQLLSSGELASRLSLDKGKVLRVLKSLGKKGLIRTEGKGRGTRYSGQP